MRPFGGFEYAIMERPPADRRHKDSRFCYAVRLNGEWQPVG